MTKFSTIWGDMEVKNITPAPAKPEGEVEKKVETPEPPAPAVEEEEEDEGGTPPAPAPTKEEVKEEEEESYEFSEEDVNKAYTMLADEKVLELDENEEFDATPSGLADAVALTVRKKLENEIASIPPVVQQFYSHIMEGKDASEFKPQVETNWAEVLQTDEENQKLAYYEFLKRQKLSDAEAEDEVDDAVSRGLLDKKSKIAFSSLITQQEELNAKKTQAQKEAAKAQEAQAQKDRDSINKQIDTMDEFAGFKLDEKKKQSFKDYLFKLNPRSGKTQMQMNMSDNDRRLRLAFLDFVDYNKADLTKEITSEVTNTRKKKLSRYSDKSVASTNSSRVVKTNTKNDGRGSIQFPTIFGQQKIEVED